MILIDASHIFTPKANTAWRKHLEHNTDFDTEFRYRVMWAFRDILMRYNMNKQHEVVVCIDSKNNWRKDEFKYYKYKRKQSRAKSPVDWNVVYASQNKLIEELKNEFMFRVIEVDKCEADDVIGVLSRHFDGRRDGIIIISSDKDFKQLHDVKNLKQFDANGKRVETTNALRDKEILVMIGDSSDGVPNIMSQDDSFYNGIRQKSFGPKTALKVLDENIGAIQKYGELHELKETDNYKRNDLLINLDRIPQKYKDQIVKAYYDFDIKGSYQSIYNFFYRLDNDCPFLKDIGLFLSSSKVKKSNNISKAFDMFG